MLKAQNRINILLVTVVHYALMEMSIIQSDTIKPTVSSTNILYGAWRDDILMLLFGADLSLLNYS